jgi:hypothetical protein
MSSSKRQVNSRVARLMFRVFRRKADAARPARKQSFAQRGGWNLNVGCPAMTSTGYMTALGR